MDRVESSGSRKYNCKIFKKKKIQRTVEIDEPLTKKKEIITITKQNIV